MKKISTLVAAAIIFFISTLAAFAQEVSPSGSFSYTYPIKLPPGTNGMAPNLALVYDSSAGNGILGMGWSIAGLSTIERDSSYPINFDVNDHYIYNGQKLIKDANNYYHTEKESYQKIHVIGNNPNSASCYWIVENKDGSKLYYGETEDSRINAVGMVDKYRLWALSKVEDACGNSYSVEYSEDTVQGDYYPHRIKYTLGGNIAAFRTVEFIYESRIDVAYMYSPTLVFMSERLKWIEVKNGTELVNKYELGYRNDSSTKRSLLAWIQEYGDDGTTKMPKTSFSWQVEGTGILSWNDRTQYSDLLIDLDTDPSNYSYTKWFTGDVNGDGKTDIFCKSRHNQSGQYYIYTWLSDGAKLIWNYSFSSIVTVDLDNGAYAFPEWFTGDVNGDGKTDLIYKGRNTSDGEYYIYTWLSDGIKLNWNYSHSHIVTSILDGEIGYKRGKWFPGDINGDGRTDLIYKGRTGGQYYIYSWISNGNTLNWNSYNSAIAIDDIDDENIYQYPEWFTGDINGDGRTDLIYKGRGVQNGEYYIFSWLSNGSKLNWNEYSSNYPAGVLDGDLEYLHGRWFPGDINGDGKTDLIYKGRKDNKYYIFTWVSNGKSLYYNQSHSIIDTSYDFDTGENPYILPEWFADDINGDGRTDLIYKGVNTADDNKYYVYTWLSDGIRLNWVGNTSGTHLDGYDVSVCQYWTTGDIDGDGNSDLIEKSKFSNGRYFTSTWLANGAYPDILKSVINTSGGTCSIEHTPATQAANAFIPSNSAYPIIADVSPRPLVTKVTYDDGMGGSGSSYEYEYHNGLQRIDVPWKRTSLGFEWQKVIDPIEASTTTYFDQTDRYRSRLVVKTESHGKDTKLYRSVEYAYNAIDSVAENTATKSLASKFIYPTQEVTKEYPTGELSEYIEYRTTYGLPDPIGNPTTIEYSGDYMITGDESKITYEYTDLPPAAYISKPKRITKESRNLIGVMGTESERRFYYDGSAALGAITKGLLTREETENGANDLIQTYEYDIYGNLIKYKDPRANAGDYAGYTQQIEYDDNYQTLPETVTDAKGRQTVTGYDSFMRPVTATDVNGIEWRTIYDQFGRVVKEVKPGDTELSPTKWIIYNDSASLPDSPRSVSVGLKDGSADGYLWTHTYYDGLGREIQTKSESDTSGAWITVDRYYDDMGRNFKTSVPYPTSGSGFIPRDGDQKYKEIAYDEIGREKTVHNTDTTTRSTVYGLHDVITIDENGHVTAQSVYGNQLFNYTYGGDYTYEDVKAGFNIASFTTRTITKKAYDGTTITDNNGNTIQTRLNMVGWKLFYSDPDMGTWYYQYDQNGNLIWQKDALNQIITFTYDELNRPLIKHYQSGEEIRYYYDEQTNHGVSLGRLTRVAKYNGTSESDEQFFVYDSRGRVISQIKTINGVSRTLLTEYDSLDRVTEETYPAPYDEGIVYEYGESGRLNQVHNDAVSGGYTYVSGILYSPLGKIIVIDYGNNTKTIYDYYDLPGEQDSIAQTAFSYRLKNINVSLNFNSLADLSFQYDKKDNVGQKDVYLYGATNYHFTENFLYDEVDRLTDATCVENALYTPKAYLYDAINNIMEKDGRTYTYGGIGPHQVTNDGVNTYTYDLNGNMATKNGVQYAYDVDNRLTSITGQGAYSYDSSGQRSTKTENGVTTYYFFPHYEEEVQGAQTKCIKYYFANGIRVAQRTMTTTTDELLYFHADHLGSAICITNSSGAVTEAMAYDPFGTMAWSMGSSDIDYLFTGQERDESSGLYYYGARYYDPVLGRFITPDTVLDGLNRYAYCHNNPVKYTDPTGHAIGVDDDPNGHPIVMEPDGDIVDTGTGQVLGNTGITYSLGDPGSNTSTDPQPEPVKPVKDPEKFNELAKKILAGASWPGTGKHQLATLKPEIKILLGLIDSDLSGKPFYWACAGGAVCIRNYWIDPDIDPDLLMSASKLGQSGQIDFYKDINGKQISDPLTLAPNLNPGDVLSFEPLWGSTWHTTTVLANDPTNQTIIYVEYHEYSPGLPRVQVWMSPYTELNHYFDEILYGGGPWK